MLTSERKKKADQKTAEPMKTLVEHPPTLGTDVLTGMRLGSAERKLRIKFGLFEADTRLEGFERHIGRVGVPMRSENGFERANDLDGVRLKFTLDTFLKVAPANWVAEVRKYFSRAPIITRFFEKNAPVLAIVPDKQVGNA